MSRDCRRFRDALVSQDSLEDAELRRHAEVCTSCRPLLDARAALLADLPAWHEQHAALPPHFATRSGARKAAVLEALDSAHTRSIPWRFLAPAAVAGAVLLLVLGGPEAPRETAEPPLTVARSLRVGGVRVEVPGVSTTKFRSRSLSDALSKARKGVKRPSGSFRFDLPTRPQTKG